jgi:hypothetical protein
MEASTSSINVAGIWSICVSAKLILTGRRVREQGLECPQVSIRLLRVLHT